MKTKIKSSEYLYDINLKDYIQLPYDIVLLHKIKAGKELMKKLVIDDDMEDSKRINDVGKAMDFNRDLLIEAGYSTYIITRILKELN